MRRTFVALVFNGLYIEPQTSPELCVMSFELDRFSSKLMTHNSALSHLKVAKDGNATRMVESK